MKIIYKCRCMAAETELDVPDRRPSTDVAAWMDVVMKNVGFDHRELSSHCRETKLEYARIPVADGVVGAAPEKD